MENIVYQSEKGNAITTSRLVAIKFQREHKSVLRAIDNLECSPYFKERNFAPLINNELHPSPLIKEREYIMTRDGFSFLAMGFTGKEAAKFKEEFIAAFNKMEMELQLKQQMELNQITLLPDFNNPAKAARAWADEYEAKVLAETKVKELEPKAEVFDQICNAVNLKTVGEVAKSLHSGSHRLFQLLRELKIIMPCAVIPYQSYINAGYFEVKVNYVKGTNRSFSQTFVTGKGQTWIAKIYQDHHHKIALQATSKNYS